MSGRGERLLDKGRQLLERALADEALGWNRGWSGIGMLFMPLEAVLAQEISHWKIDGTNEFNPIPAITC